MRFFRALGKIFWRFMVIFSFIVNVVLLVVVVALLVFIFDIKSNIAQPLVTGLHSSFVGLDSATIDWTIPVRADVPVNLDIAINRDTIVTLTEDVPLTVVAQIVAPGLTVNNATVYLSLPKDLQLPVALDLPVEVRDTLPVSLDVRAVIPLQNTQLHDVAENLRLLFEPLAIGLTNLPSNFSEVGPFVGDVLNGRVNLLATNDYTARPWQGFSQTAGMNYDLLLEAIPSQNLPHHTGIVSAGGIPALDEQLRPEVYAAGGPAAVNDLSNGRFTAQGVEIPAYFYDGSFAKYRLQLLGLLPVATDEAGQPVIVITPTPTPLEGDYGILPTPTPSS